MPYQAFIPIPSESQSLLARLTEAFKDFPDDKKPLITKMGLLEKVDCAFGEVPKGSPLSYQCPVPSRQDSKTYDTALPRPLLPRAFHKLEPLVAFPVLSAQEQEHVEVMQITTFKQGGST